MKILCKNHDELVPDCLGVADGRYTMDFRDVGGDKIYWCANCGPGAHALDQAIQRAFKTCPGFAKAFEEAIEEAERAIEESRCERDLFSEEARIEAKKLSDWHRAMHGEDDFEEEDEGESS